MLEAASSFGMYHESNHCELRVLVLYQYYGGPGHSVFITNRFHFQRFYDKHFMQ